MMTFDFGYVYLFQGYVYICVDQISGDVLSGVQRPAVFPIFVLSSPFITVTSSSHSTVLIWCSSPLTLNLILILIRFTVLRTAPMHNSCLPLSFLMFCQSFHHILEMTLPILRRCSHSFNSTEGFSRHQTELCHLLLIHHWQKAS